MRAYENWGKLSSDSFARSRELTKWKQFIKANWSEVQIILAGMDNKSSEVGVALKVEAEVTLGIINTDDVVAQIYSGTLDADRNINDSIVENMKCIGEIRQGVYKYEGYIACDESGLFGYSVRVSPEHADMTDQFGLEVMRWIGDKIVAPVSTEIPASKEVEAIR